MKDEIDAVQGKSTNLRRSLMNEVSQTQDLHHENKLLKQKLATYRRMVQAQNNTAKPPHHPKQSAAQATIPTVIASSAELATNNRVDDAKQVSRSHNHTIDSQGHEEGLT
jgi:cell shape-determining protein MreC